MAILRLTQELAKKLGVKQLDQSLLHENPLADWSCRLFDVERKKYVLISNTKSLYSCVMPAKRLGPASKFTERLSDAIEEYMATTGQSEVFEKWIAPSFEEATFAKALNRSVTGSMNELNLSAVWTMQMEEWSLHQIANSLNDFLLSSIAEEEDGGYGKPREAFQRIVRQLEEQQE